MQTKTETDYLESLIEEDTIDHGVCSLCYPLLETTSPMFSLCGVDVSGDSIMPESEVVDKCEACMNAGSHIGLNGKLHFLGKI